MSYFVKLFSSETVDLANYSPDELIKLHFDQEVKYAQAIIRSEPFSEKRKMLFNEGYDLIHKILYYRNEIEGHKFSISIGEFGSKIVRKTIKHYLNKNVHNKIVFFEAGFGPGEVIKTASEFENIEIIGCDVDINNFLYNRNNIKLMQGTVFETLKQIPDESLDVFYWSDVIEHIVPDEIDAHLNLVYSKLKKKGMLITITPNWHSRPSDITRLVLPVGTEAQGFHLKEYTYNDLSKMLKKAGFKEFNSPFLINFINRKPIISFRRFIYNPSHSLKKFFEPVLANIPYPLKMYAIRMFYFDTIMAIKK